MRYIEVPCIIDKDGNLIPFYNENLVYEKSEDYGEFVKLKNERKNLFLYVNGIFDMKTKKLLAGIEIEYKQPSELNKGQTVFYEKSHHKLIETIIEDIIYNDYEIVIVKGKNIDSYRAYAKDIEIQKDSIYNLKIFKPQYKINIDGLDIIANSYSLFSKIN